MNRSWTRYLPAALRDKLEGRHDLQGILSNAGWLLADNILRMGVALVVGVWMARYLGPAQFGDLNYALAFAAIFGTLANLGLDSIVVRDIVRDPENSPEILGTAFVMKLTSGVIAFALTVGCVYLVSSGDYNVVVLTAIVTAGMFFQAFDVIDFWFQSRVASRYTVIARNFAFFTVTILKIILILLKAKLVAFAIIVLAEVAITAASLAYIYHRSGHNIFNWKSRYIRAIKLLKTSWPLTLAGAFIAIYMKIDQIMLGNMIGNHAVGLYTAAVRISEIWYFIPSAIVASVYPTIIKMHEQNRDKYLLYLKQLYTLLVWVALVVAIPMSFFSTFFVTLFFGEHYSAAGPALSIHIWTAIFTFYGIGKSIFIQCEDMQLFSFICTVSGALSNIALNLLLIPRYHIIGAAIATLCAQIVASTVIPLLYERDRISVRLFLSAFFDIKAIWRI